MSKLEEEKLETMYGGGTSVSGTLINALTEVIRVLYDAGHAVGSSFRRIKENDLCSVE